MQGWTKNTPRDDKHSQPFVFLPTINDTEVVEGDDFVLEVTPCNCAWWNGDRTPITHWTWFAALLDYEGDGEAIYTSIVDARWECIQHLRRIRVEREAHHSGGTERGSAGVPVGALARHHTDILPQEATNVATTKEQL